MNELIPRRGRPAQPLSLDIVRELCAEDLTRCADGPITSAPPLQKIRAAHHRPAKLIAEGYTLIEVAAVCGTTPQRLSQLQNDPAFANLVAYYHDQSMTALIDDQARLKSQRVDIAGMANEEIISRLSNEDKVKSIPLGELRKLSELDPLTPQHPAITGGAPPANITLNFGTALREVKDVAPEVGNTKTIEHVPQGDKGDDSA